MQVKKRIGILASLVLAAVLALLEALKSIRQEAKENTEQLKANEEEGTPEGDSGERVRGRLRPGQGCIPEVPEGSGRDRGEADDPGRVARQGAGRVRSVSRCEVGKDGRV